MPLRYRPMLPFPVSRAGGNVPLWGAADTVLPSRQWQAMAEGEVAYVSAYPPAAGGGGWSRVLARSQRCLSREDLEQHPGTLTASSWPAQSPPVLPPSCCEGPHPPPLRPCHGPPPGCPRLSRLGVHCRASLMRGRVRRAGVDAPSVGCKLNSCKATCRSCSLGSTLTGAR